MPRRSRSTNARRPAIAGVRLAVLCVSVVAFLTALLRVTPLAQAGGSPAALTTVPDHDTPMLVEEHGKLVRVAATRPARPASRMTTTVAPFEPAPIASLLMIARSSFTIDARRSLSAGIARPRTHVELMVFLI